MTKIMESKFTACKQNTLSIVRVIWENAKDVMYAVKKKKKKFLNISGVFSFNCLIHMFYKGQSSAEIVIKCRLE